MASFDALLAALLSNDDQVRKPAESSIRTLSAHKDVVPELLRVVQHAEDPQVRQLAAVLLRKRIGKHWQHLGAEGQHTTQALLLHRIMHEPVHSVRRSLADVTAVVAKQTVPHGQWPDLLGTMQNWSMGASADHRELALLLFSSLAEIISEHLAPALPALIGIVAAGLKDSNSGVRLAALHAVERLVPMVHDQPHVIAFHALVANLLECARGVLVAGHEEEAVLCFQLLVEACEANAPLVTPHMAAVLTLATEAVSARQLGLETRDQAIQVVSALARCKPKQMVKHKELLKQVVSTLCSLACEPAPGGEANEREAGVKTPRTMGGQALDTLALSLPTQHLGPQVLAFARAALTSADANDRCGALTVVAVLAEGGAVWLRKRLDEAMPLILAGLKDPDASVRAAAAFAVGQLAEFMAHEVVQHHDVVLPAVLEVMAHETDPDLQERACYALDTFCEALEPAEIAPYMAQVIEQLVRVLARGAHVAHAGVQEVALSAIASTATAAGADFAPHLATVLPALSYFMSAANTEMIPCRCRATECLGIMLEHLVSTPAGAEAGLPELVPGIVDSVLAGWVLGHSELREYSHGLFASLAKGMQANFAPYLVHVVPLAVTSLEQDEGELLLGGDDDDDGEQQALGGPATGAMSSDDDGSQDGGGNPRGGHVRSGVLDEKCAAMQALALYAAHTGAAFAPHLEVAAHWAMAMADEEWHEELQIQAVHTLPRLVVGSRACFPMPPGSPPGSLHPNVQAAIAAACPPLATLLSSPDRGVVSSVLGAWRALLEDVGAEPLAPWLQQLSEMIAAVLSDKAPCCEYEAEEEDEEGEGGADEASEELLAAAADLLPVFAGALGADKYAPLFGESHLPALLGRLTPGQPEDVRGLALGALAEVAERMQAHMAPHLPRLVPPLLRELRSSDAVNRQNAAFAMGVIVEGCGAQASAPHFPIPQLLQALHPLFSAKESAGTRDNAVGCVARMLLASPPDQPMLPLDQVLPAMCAALPPREDWGEAGPAYRALCTLLTAGEAVTAGISVHVPALIRALGAAVVAPKLPKSSRTLILATVHGLLPVYGPHLRPLLATLPADQQAAFACTS